MRLAGSNPSAIFQRYIWWSSHGLDCTQGAQQTVKRAEVPFAGVKHFGGRKCLCLLAFLALCFTAVISRTAQLKGVFARDK